MKKPDYDPAEVTLMAAALINRLDGIAANLAAIRAEVRDRLAAVDARLAGWHGADGV